MVTPICGGAIVTVHPVSSARGSTTGARGNTIVGKTAYKSFGSETGLYEGIYLWFFCGTCGNSAPDIVIGPGGGYVAALGRRTRAFERVEGVPIASESFFPPKPRKV